jgi:MFS family permease
MPFPLDPARRLASRRRADVPSIPQHHAAAAVLFAVDGLVFGTWASRIPAVATQVAAGPTTLGVTLLCISVGALASMQLTGALCSRLGPGLVGVTAAFAACAALALPGLCGSVSELAVALFTFGAATGTLNVSANAIGVQVETSARRPVLPSLHAGFSLGGLAGAAVGGLVAATVSTAFHLLVVGAVGALVTAAVAPILLAGDGNQIREDARSAPIRGGRSMVVLLGVIAGCTAFGEGAVTDWGALHLHEIGASPVLAASGYAGFSLAMACGRLAGNRLLRAFGPTRMVAGGALLAAAGATAVAAVPVTGIVLAGFVLIGLGLANVFPIAIARAGAFAGPAGVALASTVGYTGLLGGPPLLGIVADTVGLGIAFAIVALLAAVAAGLAALVAPSRPLLLARLAAGVRTAAHDFRRAGAGLRTPAARVGDEVRRHAVSLTVLHAQPAAPRGVRHPYPGLEALAA